MRLLRAAAGVLVAGLALGVFFRVQLLSGFGALWGSQFDGGIEAAILEHWYNVARGIAPWNRTFYFFPVADTLGYNDGYFLYGVAHAVFRAAGADIYASSALVDMAVKAVGFAGMFRALRLMFACRFGYALLGAALFTVSHGSFQHGLHQQLLSVAFLPVLALLAWRSGRALAGDRPAAFVAWGGAGCALWGAWLLTAYYAAWFATFFAAVLAVVAVPLLGRARLGVAWAMAWRHRRACALLAVLLAASAVPFLAVYLPKLSETGGQAWREVLFYIPRPNDLVNLGPDDTLWGPLYPVLCRFCTRGNFELTTGITPVVFGLFAAAAAWLVAGRDRPVLPRVVAAAVLVVLLLMVRWGGLAPWWLVWKLVPGAGGLRVVSRLLLFLAAPAIAVAMTGLQHLSVRLPPIVSVLLAMVLLAEQIRPGWTMYSHRAELARLEVPPAPAACSAFYVGATDGSEQPGEVFRLYPHNVAAMVIAELIGLPTINGHSTFDPPGWDFADPLRGDYEARVRRYAARYGVTGLCRLDLRLRTWDGPV